MDNLRWGDDLAEPGVHMLSIGLGERGAVRMIEATISYDALGTMKST